MKRKLIAMLAVVAMLTALYTIPRLQPAQALTNNSQGYIGEISLVAFNFNPKGSPNASGQILNIASNTALFSLLGTNFGGNGSSTFGLPNLTNLDPLEGTKPLHYVINIYGVFPARDVGSSNGVYGGDIGLFPYTFTPPYSRIADGQGNIFDNEEVKTDDLRGAFPEVNINYFDKTLDIYPDYMMGEVILVNKTIYNTLADRYRHMLPCDGRLLSISQNQALFSLLGTEYGGDGRTTFALPDLSKKAPSKGTMYIIVVNGLFPSRE